MDKLKYIKLENEDGSYSSSIPLAVDGDYVDINGETLINVLNNKANTDIVNTKISNLETEISSVASGSPAGVYATVSALTTADPDHNKIYIITEDGHWYYYNNGWTDGGLYQASELEDSNPTLQKIDYTIDISDPDAFSRYGYYNYFNNTLTYRNDGGVSAWKTTDFIDISSCKYIKYNLFQYIDWSHNRAVSMVTFFDKQKSFISAVIGDYTSGQNAQREYSDTVTVPDGAYYVCFSAQTEYPYNAKLYVSSNKMQQWILNANNKAAIILNANFVNDGYYLNYNDNTLVEKSGAGFSTTDYINLDGYAYLSYQLYAYNDSTYNVHVAYICFFDENKDVISVEYGASLVNGETSGEMNIPTNAKYARFTCRNQNTHYVILAGYKDSYDRIAELQDEVNIIAEELEPIKYNTKLFDCFGFVKKINLIGDSVTQGSGAAAEKDSYAGILRNMFMIENDNKMNFGFESFSPLNELHMETKMVELLSNSGFHRTWNGTTCYGSDELSSSTANSYITFRVRKQYNYMKISYEAGIAGTFGVYVGDTNLLTVTTTATDTQEAALSNAIDISNYPADTVYKIILISGSAVVSGVEIGDNINYNTFNNYGRAGIGASTVLGKLLEQESDCDLLIYALGINQISDANVDSIIPVLKASKAKKIILDLCMKSTQRNDTSKNRILQRLADEVDGMYICMHNIIPQDNNNYNDSTYFSNDGVHPSELGHESIAEVVAKKLGLAANSKGIINLIQ